MNRRHTLGLLGGSFDPIHLGHIALAQYVLVTLKNLDALWLLPVGRPRHRHALQASFQHRCDMVQRTLTDLSLSTIQLSMMDAPLMSGDPNATIHVLRKLRSQYPDSALIWIMGADAFTRFDQWLDWRDILALAHIIIGSRPHHPLSPEAWSFMLQSLWQEHEHDIRLIDQQPAGVIASMEFPALIFSSTDIRRQLQDRHSLTIEGENDLAQKLGITPSVYRYISQYNLYL